MLEKKAIDRIKAAAEMSLHHYGEPLICTYSGGKDSDVMLELFLRSGVDFEVQHSFTTVDAPETVRHIREVGKKLEEKGIKMTIQWPKYKGARTTMWRLIPQMQLPPTRTRRYCCSILKETSAPQRFIATGIRWAESRQRQDREAWEYIAATRKNKEQADDETMLLSDNFLKRSMMEHCMKKHKMVVNPIIDWTDADIWDFIASEKIAMNPLYSEGHCRVGCIGCPMAGKQRVDQFLRWPTYKQAYLTAFQKMIESYPTEKDRNWRTAQDVFDWWID